MREEAAKQPESPHMKDFNPPWRHFRYVRSERMTPRREMLPPGEHGDGCMLQASGLVAVYAGSLFTSADGNAWSYAVELGKEKQAQKIASGIVCVKEGENASEKVLKAAWEQMLPAVQALREGARNMYFCMLENAGWPADPAPIKPVPDAWYPAGLYVPEDGHPVTVAWTDIFGLEHPGDRTAIYKDGGWHWAHGDQDPVPDCVRITDWTQCPEAPDYPLAGKEERSMEKYGINDSRYDPCLDGPQEDKNSGKSRDGDCADHSNCPYISRWSCPYLNSSVCNYAVYW